MNENAAKSVLVCDTQPVAIEGVSCLLARSAGLRFAGAVCSLEAAAELTQSMAPAVVILDKALGTPAILEWLHSIAVAGSGTAPVIWGAGITEAEALRFLQAGARGIVRRTSVPETLLTCLEAVVAGRTWMEEGIFGEPEQLALPRRSHLTPREVEVAQMVQKGLRNRDIARNLGIQTGTVKIHLKHIFEKTGVRGRYGLALNGLRAQGVALPAAA